MEQDRNYGNNSGMQNKLRKYNVTSIGANDTKKEIIQSDCITCNGHKTNTHQCKACVLHIKTPMPKSLISFQDERLIRRMHNVINNTKRNNSIADILSILCIIVSLTFANNSISSINNRKLNCHMEKSMQSSISSAVQDDGSHATADALPHQSLTQ